MGDTKFQFDPEDFTNYQNRCCRKVKRMSQSRLGVQNIFFADHLVNLHGDLGDLGDLGGYER